GQRFKRGDEANCFRFAPTGAVHSVTNRDSAKEDYWKQWSGGVHDYRVRRFAARRSLGHDKDDGRRER
ncbi:MAG: hypothetical protein ACREA0_20065, partial [bacterium]